jgi:hypothetical protein
MGAKCRAKGDFHAGNLFPIAAAFGVLAAVAYARTDPPKGYTGAYAPAGMQPTPYSTGPLPQVDDGAPGLDAAARDGSTKEVKPVPCSTAARETDGSTTCVGIEGDAKRTNRE